MHSHTPTHTLAPSRTRVRTLAGVLKKQMLWLSCYAEVNTCAHTFNAELNTCAHTFSSEVNTRAHIQTTMAAPWYITIA